jgi:hypothetical protein
MHVYINIYPITRERDRLNPLRYGQAVANGNSALVHASLSNHGIRSVFSEDAIGSFNGVRAIY